MGAIQRRQLFPTRNGGGGLLSSILDPLTETEPLPIATSTKVIPPVVTTSVSTPLLSVPSQLSTILLTSAVTPPSSLPPPSSTIILTSQTSQTPIIESITPSSSTAEVSTAPPTSTVTNFQSAELASTTPAKSTNTSPPTNSFLNNKPLAGFVFGLVGLVVLVIIFVGVTFGLRRRRNKRLLTEAVSFEPTRGPFDDERALTEKRYSNGSIGVGGSPLGGSNTSHAPFTQHPVAPHQQFYDREQGYGQAYGHTTYALPTQLANDAYGGMEPATDHYNVVNAAPPATTHNNGNLFYR